MMGLILMFLNLKKKLNISTLVYILEVFLKVKGLKQF